MSKKPILEPPVYPYEQEREPSDPVRYVITGSQSRTVPNGVPQFNTQTNDSSRLPQPGAGTETLQLWPLTHPSAYQSDSTNSGTTPGSHGRVVPQAYSAPYVDPMGSDSSTFPAAHATGTRMTDSLRDHYPSPTALPDQGLELSSDFCQTSPEPEPTTRTLWSSEEDELITALRGKGMRWEAISKHLVGRSARACSLRYNNHNLGPRGLHKFQPEQRTQQSDERIEQLRQRIKQIRQSADQLSLNELYQGNATWLRDEDSLLVELHRVGVEWEDMSHEFRGRNATSCKNRYHKVAKNHVSDEGQIDTAVPSREQAQPDDANQQSLSNQVRGQSDRIDLGIVDRRCDRCWYFDLRCEISIPPVCNSCTFKRVECTNGKFIEAGENRRSRELARRTVDNDDAFRSRYGY